MIRAVLIAAFAASPAFAQPPALQAPDSLTGPEIVSRAYEAAGGDAWVNPESLYMEGYGLFWYGGDESFVRYEPYRMWRVYPQVKEDAHAADGRVRIEAMNGEQIVFQIAFDGTDTYTQDGRVEDEADSDRWASNFGFGVIRHALDEGYSVDRLADDYVDGAPAYTIRVNDPAGGSTIFNIRQHDFAVVKVGFDTPEGWHERKYSEFYTNEDGGWVQPGRVRLYYDGVKRNEIWWTRFTTGEQWDDALFRLED
ncbi:MAG: hypothetical protein ABL308_07185 [Oceanicaulis sp.]